MNLLLLEFSNVYNKEELQNCKSKRSTSDNFAEPSNRSPHRWKLRRPATSYSKKELVEMVKLRRNAGKKQWPSGDEVGVIFMWFQRDFNGEKMLCFVTENERK